MALIFKTSELMSLSLALSARIDAIKYNLKQETSDDELKESYTRSIRDCEKLKREIQAEVTLKQRDGDFD